MGALLTASGAEFNGNTFRFKGTRAIRTNKKEASVPTPATPARPAIPTQRTSRSDAGLNRKTLLGS